MLHERDVVYIALIIWCLIHTLSFWILGYLFKELLWIRLVAFFRLLSSAIAFLLNGEGMNKFVSL